MTTLIVLINKLEFGSEWDSQFFVSVSLHMKIVMRKGLQKGVNEYLVFL